MIVTNSSLLGFVKEAEQAMLGFQNCRVSVPVFVQPTLLLPSQCLRMLSKVSPCPLPPLNTT